MAAPFIMCSSFTIDLEYVACFGGKDIGLRRFSFVYIIGTCICEWPENDSARIINMVVATKTNGRRRVRVLGHMTRVESIHFNHQICSISIELISKISPAQLWVKLWMWVWIYEFTMKWIVVFTNFLLGVLPNEQSLTTNATIIAGLWAVMGYWLMLKCWDWHQNWLKCQNWLGRPTRSGFVEMNCLLIDCAFFTLRNL